MDFILDPRTPKGGGSGGGRGSSGKSSSSSSSKGSKGSKTTKNKYKGTGGYASSSSSSGRGGGGGGGNNGFQRLPVWARALIIIAIIWFVIFLIALAYYVSKELKRKKDGKSFRGGHVLGHALLASTGLWLPVYLYKKFVGSKKNKSGSYAKIEEGHGKEGNNGSGINQDSWYGGGDNNTTKYDPASHPPTYRPQSPNPAPPPAQTGAAADYYMPAPPSHTAPTQHPPQYG